MLANFEDVSLDLLFICSYWGFPTGLSSGRRSRRRAFLNESVGHVAESVEVLLAVGAGVEVGVGEVLLAALGVAEEALAESVAHEAGRGADRVDADRAEEARGDERLGRSD